MRFLMRSLGGIMMLAVACGLVLIAIGEIGTAIRQRDAERPPERVQTERVVAVRVATFEPGIAYPVITAYGNVVSWRTLELRAAAPGPLIELSPAFRDGGIVREGEILYRIDPADARSLRDSAAATLAEAEAELAEARAALALAHDDVAAARRQRDLHERALTRQRELQGRRVATDA
ncbi:MAG TPA: efflux transporter periplasmic adaptor subunit, partial [Paracoccaceae bacterium]|nr:efflux transporter periplasmic adaptor subunit [Paracoccaceae bacterium]